MPDSPTLIALTAKVSRSTKSSAPSFSTPEKSPPRPRYCHSPQTFPFLTTVGLEGGRQTDCHGSRDGHIAHTRFHGWGKIAGARFPDSLGKWEVLSKECAPVWLPSSDTSQISYLWIDFTGNNNVNSLWCHIYTYIRVTLSNKMLSLNIYLSFKVTSVS